MAPVVEGKPDVTKLTEITLQDLGRRFRMQRIIFETARDVFDQMKPNWKGNREYLLAQLVGVVEQFLGSGRIVINPGLFNDDPLRRRILLTLNMTKIVHHIWNAMIQQNVTALEPIFDREHPIRSTGDMRTWYTGKPCERTKKSHINFHDYATNSA